MKEFLLTGSLVAALTIFTGTTGDGVDEDHAPEPGISSPNAEVEGFVPHERVTLPVLREMPATESLLHDFGSQAYL